MNAKHVLFPLILLLLSYAVQKIFGATECSRLCAPGELVVGQGANSYCAKLVYLGDGCEAGASSRKVCEEAFSSCQRGLCRCLHGFSEADGHCKPNEVACPRTYSDSSPSNPNQACSLTIDKCYAAACALGKNSYIGIPCPAPPGTGQGGPGRPPPGPAGPGGPDDRVEEGAEGRDLSLISRLTEDFGCLPSDFSPLPTSRDRSPRHTQAYADQSCPRNTFCYVYAAYRLSDCKVRAYGHCCPLACPVGSPHPTATCDNRRGAIRCEDQDGYFCSRTYLTESVARLVGPQMDRHFLATCCPRHCPLGMIAVTDGHCIKKAEMGQSCWRNEQCPFSSFCKRGVCSCDSMERLIETPGGPRCVPVKRSRLGDSFRQKQRLARKKWKKKQEDNSKTSEELGAEGEEGDMAEFGTPPENKGSPGDTCSKENSICQLQPSGLHRCVCACGFREEGRLCVKDYAPCPPDTHTNCPQWKEDGECQKNPDWMMPKCAQSCQAC